jgi:hypothetical protein
MELRLVSKNLLMLHMDGHVLLQGQVLAPGSREMQGS